MTVVKNSRRNPVCPVEVFQQATEIMRHVVKLPSSWFMELRNFKIFTSYPSWSLDHDTHGRVRFYMRSWQNSHTRQWCERTGCQKERLKSMHECKTVRSCDEEERHQQSRNADWSFWCSDFPRWFLILQTEPTNMWSLKESFENDDGFPFSTSSLHF